MKRLLMLTHRLPYPPDKGERVRAYEELRALSGRFRIVLGSLAEAGGDMAGASHALSAYCERVLTAPVSRAASLVRGGFRLALGGCVTEGYFGSDRLSRLVLAEAEREPFDIVLAYSSGMVPLALRVPAEHRVADLVDVDSAKWRSYASAGRGVMSWLYGREAAGVARLERRAVEAFDATVLVSDAEAGALGVASDRVIAIGNGVDATYFSRAVVEAGGAAAGCMTGGSGGRLVFTGTMDYRPNVEGVVWFVRHVWPALRRLRPACGLWIVGRDPTASVRRLGEVAGVAVTGSVSDVRPYLCGCDVAIVPLRIARGIQNKVLEAMSMSCAVVASAAALEGLEVERDRHVVQADVPGDWVRRLDALLDDGDRLASLGAAGRRRVEERYGWPERMSGLVELCSGLVSGSGRGGAGGCGGAVGGAAGVAGLRGNVGGRGEG